MILQHGGDMRVIYNIFWLQFVTLLIVSIGTVVRNGIRTKMEERSWSHILDALRKRKEYVALFKRTQPMADWV